MNALVLKTGLFGTLMLGLLMVTATGALAHKVSIFAWVEAGQVHTESKFSGGRKVNEGKIEVFDHQAHKILEGTTDTQGYFAFPVPEKAKSLKITLIAGMGHGNHWVVTAQELGAAAPNGTPAATKDTNGEADSPEANNLSPSTGPSVQDMLERALDKKLAPIKAQIAEQSWGLRDILGGLGYIIGLVGLAGYLQNRKQRPPPS